MKKQLANLPWATYGRREDWSRVLQKCSQQKNNVHLLSKRPRFSIIVHSSSSISPENIAPIEESLKEQSYPDWEAIYINLPETCKSRIGPNSVALEINVGLSLAQLKNNAAKEAKGDWLLFLEADALLHPSTLFFYAQALTQNPLVEFIVPNTIFLNSDLSPLFLSKPKDSWFCEIHECLLGTGWAISKSLFDRLNGFNSDLPTTHEWSLSLKVREEKLTKLALPQYLVMQSYCAHLKYALPEAQGMIQEHLNSLSIPARVYRTQIDDTPLLKVQPKVEDFSKHKVSIVICFRDRIKWTERCVKAIHHYAGRVPIEIILVNNQSTKQNIDALKKSLSPLEASLIWVDYNHAFNYAQMHEVAVTKASGRYLLLLNNDVFWEEEPALEEMIAWAQLSWVGTVGMCLRYEDRRIQHGGFKAVSGGYTRLARIHHVTDKNDFALHNREVFGSTFAACLMRKEVYQSVGGLDTLNYPNGQGDVAFSFEAIRKGYRNIYLGHLSAIHLESASRGVSEEFWEESQLESRYAPLLQQMLRRDLGYNRVPESTLSIKQFIKSGIAQHWIQKSNWLRPLKPFIQKTANKWVHQT